MKKMFLLLTAASVIVASACANDKPIDPSQLPAPASKFIKLHFKDAKIALATIDKELFGDTYEVVFSDGSNVDFDGKGNWKEVECAVGASVPEAIVPAAITNYVKANYPERSIRAISRDRNDWEVDLDNGFDLTFDTNFRLIELDD